MTRTDHHSHATPQFPVYCLGFADDGQLLMGGGGGSSRTGILNKLKLCSASPDGKSLKIINEFQFGKEEDSPWSLAVDKTSKQVIVGVNASETSIKSSTSSTSFTTSNTANKVNNNNNNNEHCRLLSYAGKELKPIRAAQTIREDWSDDYPYQRFTKLNTTSTLLAIGTISSTSQRVSILSFPDLVSGGVGEDVVIGEEEGELVDLDWSPDGEWLAITTADGIRIYSVSSPLDEKPTPPGTSHIRFCTTISSPQIDSEPVVFRSAKFSRSSALSTSATPATPADLVIHAVLNNLPPKPAPRAVRGGKKAQPRPQNAFVINLGVARSDLYQRAGAEKEKSGGQDVGKVLVRRPLGTKPVTVFETSDDGRLLAYASSDYSIGILDARTLAPLLKILHAHKFATTALAFNPSATLLASASADHTVRLIVVPASFGGTSMTVLAVVIALLLLAIAIIVQRRIL